MDADTQVSQLEAALLQQAETLVREQRRNTETTRARITEESAARLQLAEQREIAGAREEAERLVVRRTQAAEARLSAELDRQRWALTEAALAGVRQAYARIVADDARYLAAIEAWLADAAAALPGGDLVAEARPADLERLSPVWGQIVARAAEGRRVELKALEAPSEGGIRIRLADNSAQVDHSYEGRASRLEDELARVAMERLFASAPDLGTLAHG